MAVLHKIQPCVLHSMFAARIRVRDERDILHYLLFFSRTMLIIQRYLHIQQARACTKSSVSKLIPLHFKWGLEFWQCHSKHPALWFSALLGFWLYFNTSFYASSQARKSIYNLHGWQCQCQLYVYAPLHFFFHSIVLLDFLHVLKQWFPTFRSKDLRPLKQKLKSSWTTCGCGKSGLHSLWWPIPQVLLHGLSDREWRTLSHRWHFNSVATGCDYGTISSFMVHAQQDTGNDQSLTFSPETSQISFQGLVDHLWSTAHKLGTSVLK